MCVRNPICFISALRNFWHEGQRSMHYFLPEEIGSFSLTQVLQMLKSELSIIKRPVKLLHLLHRNRPILMLLPVPWCALEGLTKSRFPAHTRLHQTSRIKKHAVIDIFSTSRQTQMTLPQTLSQRQFHLWFTWLPYRKDTWIFAPHLHNVFIAFSIFTPADRVITRSNILQPG